MTASTKLLTADELAAALDVSRRTLERLIADGLPRYRVRARLYRYDLGEVLAWCHAQPSAESLH